MHLFRTGLRIQSTDAVSVFCFNHQSDSVGAFTAFPVDALSTVYSITTRDQGLSEEKVVLIVSNYDNTVVNLTFPTEWTPSENIIIQNMTYGAGEQATVRCYPFMINDYCSNS